MIQAAFKMNPEIFKLLLEHRATRKLGESLYLIVRKKVDPSKKADQIEIIKLILDNNLDLADYHANSSLYTAIYVVSFSFSIRSTLVYL